MKKVIVVCIILLGFVALTNNVQAQKNLKIGIVDVENIVKQLPEALEADKSLNEHGQKLQDSLVLMEQNLQKEYNDYLKQKAMMSQENQQKKEQEIQSKNSQLLQSRQLFANEIQQMRLDFLQPIREKIVKAIEKVSKDEKINIVFDKTSQAVIYFEDQFDITFKVLDSLKRGAK